MFSNFISLLWEWVSSFRIIFEDLECAFVIHLLFFIPALYAWPNITNQSPLLLLIQLISTYRQFHPPPFQIERNVGMEDR